MGFEGNASAGDILARHLANFVAFRSDEKAAIDVAMDRSFETAIARHDIIMEGAPPRGVILILSGWACRYKVLEDGRRQIMSFLLPGDMCDLHNNVLAQMDHSIGTVTRVRYIDVPHEVLRRLTDAHPRVSQALWWQMLVNVATQREWTMNIGQRSAEERIGSLLCELTLRLRAVGLAAGDTIDLPLTQTDIAEAMGLTSVHVNRMVQAMRAAGLISWSGKVLTIPDFTRLQVASLFDPNYLHLQDKDDRDGRLYLTMAGK